MGSASHSSKRKKKRSQKRSKKRSRSIREKAKKLKQRHDWVLSSDDDSPSTLSLSCTSCSSEDDYKSKKRGRSLDRRDRKGHKKRIKRGSSMSESSKESPRVKKRKRSKRSRDSDLRKKRRRNMRRRETSISSSSDNDSEREFGRKEEKLETKERKGREMGRESSASKSRHSSRSYSLCSYHSEERQMEEYQPKRLKSIIVAKIEREEPEEEELNRDVQKDEIVYEHDDYPSRSNDSYDGVSGIYEKTRSLDDPNKEAFTSEIRTSSSVGYGVGDHLKGNGNGNDISGVGATSNPDNLEATLRQKALENLLKRQGKPMTKKLGEEESIQSVQEYGKNDDVKHTTNAHGALKDKDDHMISGPKLSLSTSTRRLLGSSNTWKRELNPQNSFKSNLSMSKETVDKGFASPSSGMKLVTEEIDIAAASEPSPSVGKSSKDETNEDDESQFQQKTMSVMRGGEMVQVSYKVKIPKKAPALARRQFKR